MRSRPFLVAAVAVALTTAVVLLGCTDVNRSAAGAPPTSSHSPPTTESAGGNGAQSRPAPTPSLPSTSPTGCSDPLASLHPPVTMPRPGNMPADSLMQTIQKRGYLVVGVSQENPGIGYYNPQDGQTEGFDIGLALAVAQAFFGDTNNRIRFRTIDIAERIPYLQDGLVDMVAYTFAVTCQRRKQVDFSVPYLKVNQEALLVPKGSGWTSLADLGGRRVCAAAKSTSITDLENYPVKPPIKVVPRPDFSSCLAALEDGDVDAISSDDVIMAGVATEDPDTQLVPNPMSDPEYYALGIPLGHPEFTRFVDGVLAQVEADGTWKALYAQWLQPLLKGPVPAPPAAIYRG